MAHLFRKNHSTVCNHSGISLAILVCLAFIAISSGCQKKTTAVNGIDSAEKGQPINIRMDTLKPGLNVIYLNGFWRHINKMPKPETFLGQGRQGPPILKIDHRFGKKEVFDSGTNRGIGVQMQGFIKLPKAGNWEFQAKSNDGIDIKIAQTQVVWDPTQHSDRFSDPMGFSAPEPGLYLLQLRYFQRKGTATLEFYWKPPGEDAFVIIPENAFWHLSESN